MREGAVLGVLTLLAAAGLSGAPADEKSKEKTGVTRQSFGKTDDGKAVDLFVLKNKNGVTVKIMTLGAAITELWVPDSTGKMADVNLGFDDITGFQGKSNPFFGCIVGRVCQSHRQGQVHARRQGVHTRRQQRAESPARRHEGIRQGVWKAEDVDQGSKLPAGPFQLYQPGRRGRLSRQPEGQVTYTLTDDNELKIDYAATTDKADAGQPDEPRATSTWPATTPATILGHELTVIAADKYTPTDDTLIPTGKIEPVKGTPFDFTKPTAIGRAHRATIKQRTAWLRPQLRARSRGGKASRRSRRRSTSRRAAA